MRVKIPEFQKKNDLFAYLKSNRKDLIAKKRSTPIRSDVFDYGCTKITAKDLAFIGKNVKKSKPTLKVEGDDSLGKGEIGVDVITNMAGWCDSYMDVLIPDCWNKTISERGASGKQLIYHLKNHGDYWDGYTTDHVIGGNVQMSSKWVDLAQFNIESDLTQGQALIGSSVVKEKYDEKCFYLYSDDEVKQHSIGLRYIQLELCINSEEDEYRTEKENWEKFYKYVINKAKVDGRGFFWAVPEIKLLEYSAVLYGANELTTVQSTSKTEPLKDTPKEPQVRTLDYGKLMKGL